MLGDFSALADGYDQGRRGYATNIIKRIVERMPRGLVLDLGAGTCRGSRQIRNCGRVVIACDISLKMLSTPEAAARMRKRRIAGNAMQLPFRSGCFAGVSALSSFHWFANQQACREIARVLSSGGMFCVLNKIYEDEISGFADYLFLKHTGQSAAKRQYDPFDALEVSGFLDIKKITLPCEERVSPREVIRYYQTNSRWKLVQETQRRSFVDDLRLFMQQFLEGSLITRIATVTLVSARAT